MDNKRSGKSLLRRASFLVAVLACLWLIAWRSAKFLIVSEPLEHADAIVVLSGSSTLVERAQHAAKLYAEHRAPTIILTTDNQQGGWSQALQRNPYSYERTAQELVKYGVPSNSIQLVQPPIYSTWDEARLIREYAIRHNLNSILIVTSSYHSRRALWTFRKMFGSGRIQIGIDPVVTGVQTPAAYNWFLFPSGWQFIVTEYVKLVYYLLRGLNDSPTAFWYGSRIKTLGTWRERDFKPVVCQFTQL